MEEKLSYYIHCFANLNRSKSNGGAPHKPILLLSVINLFEQGFLFSNTIKITPELVAAFRNNWNMLVETQHHPIFALPFYHMNSEPFWNLKPNIGYEKVLQAKGSIRSLSSLKKCIYSAEIDINLFNLLSHNDSRELLKTFILENYFPNTAKVYNTSEDLFSGINLNEDATSYQQKLLELRNILDANAFEEEVFVRSGIFKREIPKIYNNTCAISRMRIDATANISLIDACHIVPFAESYNDTITNGIALCPNLHRAFDRGLISISDDYKVLLAKNFIENKNSNYSISQFENLEIMLPSNAKHYPSLEGLRWQKERFGV